MKPSDIVEQGIAQVLEGRRIFSELTVNENLRLGGHTASKDIKENTDRIYDLFPLLAPRAKDVAGYLSGGEQQMLAIGRALMSNPKCLLLDEPSLGLAPKLVDQIKEFIVEINQQGVSVLLVEQNANMALSIATHGYIMGTGGILVSLAFFSLMTIASLTSSISMLEVPVSYAIEYHEISRKKASAGIGVLVTLISLLIVSIFFFIYQSRIII